MQKFFTGTWWILLVRGILAVLFGIFALSNTAAAVIVLFWIFIFYAVVDGVFTIIMAIIHRHDTDRWWGGLVYGLFSILFGLMALIWPEITALVLLYIIAARAIIGGFSELGLALSVSRDVRGEWVIVVTSILSIVFGIWMFVQPLIGGWALMWVIGLYALALGIVLFFQSFRAWHQATRH